MMEFTFNQCEEMDEQFVKDLIKNVVMKKRLYDLNYRKAPVVNLLEELKRTHVLG